jgi:hypothetical protein
MAILRVGRDENKFHLLRRQTFESAREHLDLESLDI